MNTYYLIKSRECIGLLRSLHEFRWKAAACGVDGLLDRGAVGAAHQIGTGERTPRLGACRRENRIFEAFLASSPRAAGVSSS